MKNYYFLALALFTTPPLHASSYTRRRQQAQPTTRLRKQIVQQRPMIQQTNRRTAVRQQPVRQAMRQVSQPAQRVQQPMRQTQHARTQQRAAVQPTARRGAPAAVARTTHTLSARRVSGGAVATPMVAAPIIPQPVSSVVQQPAAQPIASTPSYKPVQTPTFTPTTVVFKGPIWVDEEPGLRELIWPALEPEVAAKYKPLDITNIDKLLNLIRTIDAETYQKFVATKESGFPPFLTFPENYEPTYSIVSSILPDGRAFMTISSNIVTLPPDELRYALAHEIAHYKFGYIAPSKDRTTLPLAEQRQQEYAADEWAVKNIGNTNGALTFLKRVEPLIQKYMGDHNLTPAQLATPLPAERITAIKQLEKTP